MPKSRYINTFFWDDPYIMDLDPSEKLLFLYLLTNSMTNIAGIYELPLKRISFDTGFDRDMVEKILQHFHDDEKVLYKDGWVAIRNWPKHQSSSATVLEGIKRCLKDAPESMVPYVYPIGTLCKSAYIYSRVESSKKSYRENVAMTEDEHAKLVDNYGKAATEKGIVKLDNYKGTHGKKYKSDYRAMLSWVMESVGAYPLRKTVKVACPKCSTEAVGTLSYCSKCGLDRDEWKGYKA